MGRRAMKTKPKTTPTAAPTKWGISSVSDSRKADGSVVRRTVQMKRAIEAIRAMRTLPQRTSDAVRNALRTGRVGAPMPSRTGAFGWKGNIGKNTSDDAEPAGWAY